MSIILTIQEAEIRRTAAEDQSRRNISEIPISTNKLSMVTQTIVSLIPAKQEA
jgi:hypothetical protein